MKITVISTVHATAIFEAVHDLKRDLVPDLDFSIYYPTQIDQEEIDDEDLTNDLTSADAVLIDIRGAGRASDLVHEALKGRTNIAVNLMGPFGPLFGVTRLGALSGERIADRMKPPGGAGRPDEDDGRDMARRRPDFLEIIEKYLPDQIRQDAKNYVTILKYWGNGGRENYYNMFLFLIRRYLDGAGLPEPREPIEYPDCGIYHPDLGYFPNREDYLKVAGYSPEQPAIGIMFHGGMHLEQNMSAVRAFIRALPEFAIIPTYSAPEYSLRSIEKFFFDGEKPCVDALINLRWFRINGGPLGGNPTLTQDLLRRLNVPVFAPACMFSQDVSAWEEETAGISPIMTIMAVVWPELDGCIEPIPCCGLQDVMINGCEAKDTLPIEDRIERITSRIRNWMRLRNLRNHDKKVAVIIYGYPPGEGNLGGASYLDTFVSVRRMLETFKEQGYTVELPDAPLHELFEGQALINSGEWCSPAETLEHCFALDAGDYQAYFDRFPEDVRQDVIARWGDPPGGIMTSNGKILVPGIQFGNIFVGIQPARPPLDETDVAKAAHDKTVPPHHQYIGFYHWLEEFWGADLVFHVGTHGLAEFTKGKEVGMSSRCFPDILIGNMPHLYIYSVVNTSESTIAKRRLYGTIISYNSPPFSTSDLYEEYIELEDLIAEYDEAVSRQQEVRAARVEEKIFDLAGELNFSATSIPKIHEEVYEMKRSIIPMGLHILGERYSDEALKRYVEFLLRYDRDGMRALNRIFAEAEGIDYDEAIRNKSRYARVLDRIDGRCRETVDHLISESVDAAVAASGVSGTWQDEMRRTLTSGLELARDYADNSKELANCLRGLSTEFIEPSLGGDVIRKPDVLPTGKNINQFDPTRIPTETACERGAEIAAKTLQKFIERDQRYPEGVGIVLWGFETTNSGGETIGQILAYLGVRVVRRFGSWSTELEVVPLEKLGRPRIDCHLSICGFFRDMFPNIIQLLNQAFALVSELDEPIEENFVRKHSLENLESIRQEVIDGLLTESSAKKLAYGRIYGPQAGEYGTRMLSLLEDSVWKDEKDLAEIYMESMSHLYTDNVHGEKNSLLYRRSVGNIELISQVRDRHDHEIVDLDHYFEFFGGLNKAVETVSGRTPMLMISDTTREAIKTEDIRDVITRGTRTRLLNPKWIDEMLKHEYHGAQQIEERVYNTLGLAATTHAVDNWIWSSIANRFIFDEEMRKRLQENNQFAAAGIVERLLEAEQRGYWDATEEELEQLRQAYLEIEGDIEARG